jgi:hypothetical protein
MAAATVGYPQGGGHRWVYLNWALGLRSAGCEVVWLELFPEDSDPDAAAAAVRALLGDLRPFGFDRSVAFIGGDDESRAAAGVRGDEPADGAELLVNLRYGLPEEFVARFPRSALIDIDPGLTQLWLSRGHITVAPHDVYFTIGENVGGEQSRFPDCGFRWLYTPPAVALDEWPRVAAPAGAAWTTVSHWWPATDGDWVEIEGEWIDNSKRDGFRDILQLPEASAPTLELALGGTAHVDEEVEALERRGWRVRDAWEVARTASSYRDYVQASRGELSGAKRSTVLLEPGWISDRSVCYLASGKPIIVPYTGPSRFLPDADGVFRFRNASEAEAALRAAEHDYEHHCGRARELAETHFDAGNVARRLLERALG